MAASKISARMTPVVVDAPMRDPQLDDSRRRRESSGRRSCSRWSEPAVRFASHVARVRAERVRIVSPAGRGIRRRRTNPADHTPKTSPVGERALSYREIDLDPKPTPPRSRSGSCCRCRSLPGPLPGRPCRHGFRRGCIDQRYRSRRARQRKRSRRRTSPSSWRRSTHPQCRCRTSAASSERPRRFAQRDRHNRPGVVRRAGNGERDREAGGAVPVNPVQPAQTAAVSLPSAFSM